MNILFLCKRHYMRHDVIVDQYARLYEIPLSLSKLDSSVDAVSLSYKHSSTGLLIEQKNLRWHSFNALPSLFIAYFLGLKKRVQSKNIDIVLASSDVLHIIIGFWLARLLKRPFCADLYDNYESFGMAKIPFTKQLYRNALRQADRIFVVSDALNSRLKQQLGHKRIVTIESSIDRAQFFSTPQQDALNTLKIQKVPGETLIGLCGAIDRSRGAEYFLAAIDKAKALHNKPIRLVLAGDIEDGLSLPDDTIYLGRLKHSEMNIFFNAMDINSISMIPNEFGKYAFPQKAYEMASAESPCIVPNFGPMADLFSESPHSFYEPCDSDSIANAIIRQVEKPQAPCFVIPTWKDQATVIKQEMIELFR